MAKQRLEAGHNGYIVLLYCTKGTVFSTLWKQAFSAALYGSSRRKCMRVLFIWLVFSLIFHDSIVMETESGLNALLKAFVTTALLTMCIYIKLFCVSSNRFYLCRTTFCFGGRRPSCRKSESKFQSDNPLAKKSPGKRRLLLSRTLLLWLKIDLIWIDLPSIWECCRCNACKSGTRRVTQCNFCVFVMSPSLRSTFQTSKQPVMYTTVQYKIISSFQTIWLRRCCFYCYLTDILHLNFGVRAYLLCFDCQRTDISAYFVFIWKLDMILS